MKAKLFFLGSALTMAAVSQAVPVYAYSNDGNPSGVNVSVQYTSVNPANQVTINTGGSNFNVYAGEMNYKVNNVMTTGLCIDLEQFANTGVQTYQQYDHVAGRVGWLLQELESATTGTQRSALQVAMWELVYDYANDGSAFVPNFGAGNFKLISSNDPNVASTATNYLNSMFSSSSNVANYFRYGSDHHQDYVSYNPVPEPATMLALGIGAAFAARRRRKAQG